MSDKSRIPAPFDSGSRDWTKISCANPPNRTVYARPGFTWYSGSSGRAVVGITFDFGPGGNCQAPLFSSPNYYKGVLIARWDAGDTTSSRYTSEYATAGAAQDAIIAYMTTTYTHYPRELPLGLLIIRDDGSATPGGIMPISPVNRGGSYIFRDIRPWLHIHRTGPE